MYKFAQYAWNILKHWWNQLLAKTKGPIYCCFMLSHQIRSINWCSISGITYDVMFEVQYSLDITNYQDKKSLHETRSDQIRRIVCNVFHYLLQRNVFHNIPDKKYYSFDVLFSLNITKHWDWKTFISNHIRKDNTLV